MQGCQPSEALRYTRNFINNFFILQVLQVQNSYRKFSVESAKREGGGGGKS